MKILLYFIILALIPIAMLIDDFINKAKNQKLRLIINIIIAAVVGFCGPIVITLFPVLAGIPVTAALYALMILFILRATISIAGLICEYKTYYSGAMRASIFSICLSVLILILLSISAIGLA